MVVCEVYALRATFSISSQESKTGLAAGRLSLCHQVDCVSARYASAPPKALRLGLRATVAARVNSEMQALLNSPLREVLVHFLNTGVVRVHRPVYARLTG